MSRINSTTAVDRLLEASRGRLDRLGPCEAYAASRRGPVLVDVRTSEQRATEGEIPGAIPVPLNVLEWRADPAADSHDPRLGGHETSLIVMCAEGYCSSLAAVRLLELGRRATDVIGGFAAWREAGLPVSLTDH